MSKFLKNVLAVICGILVVTVLFFMLGGAFFSAMVASSDQTPDIPESGVLYLDLSSVSISDQEIESDFMSIIQSSGSMPASMSLLDAILAIEKAATDPAVKYLYIRPDDTSMDITIAQELRSALSKFRNSGKPVIAGIEKPSTISYYIASVADKVYLSSYLGQTYTINGVGTQLIYFKDLLDHLGVNVQLIRHGKYKSAGETFVNSTPSPENIEQNRAMIDAIWESVSSEICESRGITVDAFNSAIDNLKLNSPEDFLEEGLVDELFNKEEMKQQLADLAVEEDFEDIEFIKLADYAAAMPSNIKAKQKIAIIYVNGDIVDGYGTDQVAGDRYASIIADIREDSDVKAVLFRVNSPGGSVAASEKIKTEIDAIAENIPVIVSYGSYAASGGYWISSNLGKIFANPTTLTGSIGVFSMIPDISKIIKEKARLNIYTIGSNKHSDMLSLTSTLDADEKAYLQASVESIYTRFVEIVSEGRNLEPDYVDSIAQGRVWAGTDAKEVGLIDEFGTIKDALEYTMIAASEDGTANLADWKIEEYPKSKTMMEQMLESMTGGSDKQINVFTDTQFEEMAERLMLQVKDWDKNSAKMMARMPYDIIIR